MARHARLHRILLCLVCCVALVSVQGCTGPVTEGGREPDAPASRTSVAIGFAAPFSGDDPDAVERMQRAITLALREANRSNDARVSGVEFTLAVEDDGGDRGAAVEAAERLAGNDRVVAVIGHPDADCMMAAADTYEQAGLALLTLSTDSGPGAGRTLINKMLAREDVEARRAANVALDRGMRRAVVIDSGDERDTLLGGWFAEAFAEGGGTVLEQLSIGATATIEAGLVESLASLEPEVVYYAGESAGAAALSRELIISEVDVPLFGGPGLCTPEYIKAAGPQTAEGDLATVPWVPVELQPRGADFGAAYTAEYGEGPGPLDSYAYDQAWMIMRAVIEAGVERSAVAGWIRQATFEGVSGTISFDENGDIERQQVTVYEVVDGQWTRIEE